MLVALGFALLAASPGLSELPPDVQADLYLVEAERQIGEGDYRGAAETLDKILALSRAHGFKIPVSFWFKHASVLLKAGGLDQAEQSVIRYVREVGRDGEHYVEALMLLDQIKQEKTRWSTGSVFRDSLRSGGEGPQMTVLPAGSFRMGCLSNDGDCGYREKPVHDVRIARPFAVSVYEVTFEEYDRFTASTGRGRANDWGWGRGRRPVIKVSWEDAQAYVSWLSSQTGAEYRLLSESEWEYAARAGSSTKYSWGDAIGRNRANCPRDSCGDQWEGTAPVGSFEPNGFGLYDMHGNVWEWVADCWNGNYRGAPTDGSAWMQGNCKGRVLRGGSWSGYPRYLRSADRFRNSTDFRNFKVGFRVARTLTP